MRLRKSASPADDFATDSHRSPEILHRPPADDRKRRWQRPTLEIPRPQPTLRPSRIFASAYAAEIPARVRFHQEELSSTRSEKLRARLHSRTHRASPIPQPTIS